MRFPVLILLLVFIPGLIRAQSDTVFNHTDAQNRKQGFWKKSYPNGKLMYHGFFKDDKPAGEMHRYFESGKLKALLNYKENGETASARLFYEDGNLAATGNFYNTLKDSIWTYYSFYNKSVTASESYIKGARHGFTVSYYDNGDISEKTEWKNNKKSGIWEQYFPGNILKLKASYSDNKLEGEFVVYSRIGKPYISGNYKNNLREGTWTFYNENGTVQQTLNYKSDKAAEEEKLSSEQEEYFRLIDEAQGKFKEPDETDFLEQQNR